MKVDLDLIGQVLHDLQIAKGKIQFDSSRYNGITYEQFKLLIVLLEEAGFIEAEIVGPKSHPTSVEPKGLTQNGCSFLELISKSHLLQS